LLKASERGSAAGFQPIGYKPARKYIVKGDDVFVVESLKRFDFIQRGRAHSFFRPPQLYALHSNDAARFLLKEELSF
jgi:hypothetical protein